MAFLRGIFQREPVGVIALLVSILLVIIQSGYVYDKFRQRILVSVYHAKWNDLEKCKLSQLRVENPTERVVKDIRLVVVFDWVTKRDKLDELEFHHRSDSMLAKQEFKFLEGTNLYIPFFISKNVITIPKMNPGEWLDLVVGYRTDMKAEETRRNFDDSSSEYFTPRISNVSSDDGKAIILHHEESCLIDKFQPSNDSWRFW